MRISNTGNCYLLSSHNVSMNNISVGYNEVNCSSDIKKTMSKVLVLLTLSSLPVMNTYTQPPIVTSNHTSQINFKNSFIEITKINSYDFIQKLSKEMRYMTTEEAKILKQVVNEMLATAQIIEISESSFEELGFV